METTQNTNLKKKHQHQTAAAPSKSRTETQLQIHNHTANIDDQNNKKKNCVSDSEQEMKLAALAISLNVRLRTSDMPVSMQEHAFRYTRSLFDNSGDAPPSHRRLSPTFLACSLKKEFDGVYGPAWHCVVGKSFGSFVTHSAGGFVYFCLDSLSFLLFKTEVQLIKVSPLPPP